MWLMSRLPRQQRQVLAGGKTLVPVDEESGGCDAVSIGKAAFAVFPFAFDKEATRIVFEAWLAPIAADCGGVELV